MILRSHALRGEPIGPFPAKLLAEHGAPGLEALVAGRGAQRPGGGTFLVREVNGEDVGVGLLVLRLEVALGGVVAKAARLHAEHVDGRLALHNPFGQLPAGAAGGGDAEAVALVEPEVGQPPGRADDGAAVRRVGDGAVVNFLNAHFGEGGHPVHGGLDVRRQALQVLREQFVLDVVGRTVQVAARRALLIGAENEATTLLAQIPGAVGFPQHAHFRQPRLVPGHHLRMRLGDDELMLHRQHRHVQAHHRARGAGVAAGGRDHMFAADVASRGLDQPIAPLALNGRHLGLAHDFRPLGAGAPGQGLGEVRRLNVAVVGVANGAHQAVNVA